MGVAAADVVDMQGHQAVVDEPLEELKDEVHVEFADARARILGMVFKSGPSGTVDDHA
ncbi:hypothetical protein D3C83_239650 [compost metagenome]